MGSLVSPPRVSRRVSQPVFIESAPAQTSNATAAPSSSPASSPAPETNAAQDNTNTVEETKQNREQNLLNRSRGRVSTVLTGFTGLLSDTLGSQNGSGTPSGRKTLLGE